MERGRKSGRTSLPVEQFSTLGPQYASLGADLDYYEHLRELAGEQARQVLQALKDVAIDTHRRALFENEDALSASLLRFSPAKKVLSDIEALFEGRPDRLPGQARFVFTTNTGGREFSVPIDFTGPGELPGNLNVIIGPNGAGKTRLLANLAISAFDSGQDGSSRETEFGNSITMTCSSTGYWPSRIVLLTNSRFLV